MPIRVSARRSSGFPLKDHFFEDSTYWNPSWTLAHGAIETTDIGDMTRTAIGIGTGKLLSRRSYLAQIDPHIGFGKPAPKTCERCMTLNKCYGYGIGLAPTAPTQWLLQNPLFAGRGGDRVLPALAEDLDRDRDDVQTEHLQLRRRPPAGTGPSSTPRSARSSPRTIPPSSRNRHQEEKAESTSAERVLD